MNKVVELSGVTTSVDEDGSLLTKNDEVGDDVVDVGANPGAQRLVHSAPAQWALRNIKIEVKDQRFSSPAAHL